MEHNSTFIALLLITVLAVLVPVLVSRMPRVRIPIVVGEILVGVVIGRSGLDLVQTSSILTFLADFGFVFLMFLSGNEIDFGVLSARDRLHASRPRWQESLPMALIFFALTLVLAVGVGFGLVELGLARNPVLIGIILSTTSLSIVVPIVKEHGLSPTSYGQALIVAALISDFGSLLILSGTVAVISTGFSFDLLLSLLLLGAFLTAMKVVQWMKHLPWLPTLIEELSHATAQIRVRLTFALIAIWVVMAELLGVEVILGAFLAGAIVSLSSREGTPLREKLDAIGYGFFVPIFFITVGADFNLKALLASRTTLFLVPLLIAASYLLKIFPALIYRFRFHWKKTLAAGILQSSRLSLIIAVSAIALKLSLITEAFNAAIILTAIFTCTVSPLLFLAIMPARKEKERRGVIIAGVDRLALLLGHRLKRSRESIVFIGRDAGQCRRGGFHAVEGNPEDDQILERAGAREARALIALVPEPDIISSICLKAKNQFEIPKIIARTDDPRLADRLRTNNIAVVQPGIAVAVALEEALHFPAAFSMLMEKSGNVDLLDASLKNPVYANRPLKEIRLPEDVLVIGIRREGEILVPHGNTFMQKDDILFLIGSALSLQEARSMLANIPGEQNP